MQSSIARPSPAGPPSPNRFDLLAHAPSDWHGPPIRLDRLPSVAGSPDHFARLFKSSFGCTPHAFVLERRIDAAARALRSDPDRSVADIAADCGFSSQSHFTAVFQRRKGTTPRRWRLEA